MQKLAGLGELPEPLLSRIVGEIEPEYGMRGLAVLRLVSKAWRAAVQQYAGAAKSSSEADSLEALFQMMPNLRKLHISHTHTVQLNCSLWEKFKQLTSIQLSASLAYQQAPTSEGIIVDNLSSTLRDVTIRNISVAPRSFRNRQPSLARLHYKGGARPCREKLSWLPYLPELRVSTLHA